MLSNIQTLINKQILSGSQSVCSSFCPSLHLSVCLSDRLSIHLYVDPSISQSVCLSGMQADST